MTPAKGACAGTARERLDGVRGILATVAAVGRRRVAGVLVLAVAAAAAQGAGLLILVPLLDHLGIEGDPSGAGLGLEPALLLYVAIVAAAAVAVRARVLVAQRLRLAVVDGLRRDLHGALLGMEWFAFARLRTSDVTQTLSMEVGRVGFAVDFLLGLAARAAEVPILLAVAASLSPTLTLIVVVLALLAVVAASLLDRGTVALGRALGQANLAFQADLADDLAGFRLVKTLGLEEQRHARLAARMSDLRDRQTAHQRVVANARAAVQVGAAVGAALGVTVAVRGFGLALADALVLALTFARLGQTLLNTRESWAQLMHALPAYESVTALTANARAAAEPSAAGAPAAGGGQPPDIRLDGVTVRHPDSARAALVGVSATIPAGRITAVVGRSGAGKSTLSDLILGLPVPAAGRMLVDGVPLEAAGRRGWRTRVGYVPQDSFLFHDSVRANLLLARPDADEAALWDALKRAAVADVVRRLPRGLDTVVGERGDRLSGGERQRLAVARALLRNPDVLVLDEATSALDAESERRLVDTVEGLRGRVTIVVVAHRPAMARMADHLLVLDAGRLVAAGTRAEVEAAAGPLPAD
ncbi:ABC transporter ATP-binding protein [Azospirillum halopraeferens]|uniref:ABC transporter ATP-binding protein n=1 Tax=Azospirillum halopraeferens TaxID=34010 RepID=UPI000684F356|nr:ABC transporter ATP-binding protein [Azospirillum halopraeferens]